MRGMIVCLVAALAWMTVADVGYANGGLLGGRRNKQKSVTKNVTIIQQAPPTFQSTTVIQRGVARNNFGARGVGGCGQGVGGCQTQSNSFQSQQSFQSGY